MTHCGRWSQWFPHLSFSLSPHPRLSVPHSRCLDLDLHPAGDSPSPRVSLSLPLCGCYAWAMQFGRDGGFLHAAQIVKPVILGCKKIKIYLICGLQNVWHQDHLQKKECWAVAHRHISDLWIVISLPDSDSHCKILTWFHLDICSMSNDKTFEKQDK